MDLRSIKYFVQIADLGSITRAATQLGVAQPALSRHVRSIEDELGMQLLVRLPRGVRLTGAGRQFLDHCRRVMREFSRVKEELRGRTEVPRGRVVLGMSPTVGPLLLPGSVERARRSCPDVVLKVVEGFSVMLYDALLTGRVDVAVLTNPPASRALAMTPLISEPIVVLAPPQSRGTRRFFTLAELAKTPIIATEAIRAIVEEQLGRSGARLNVEVEIDAVEAIRQLLLRGVGVTVMPVSTFHEDIRAGRIAAYQIADANVHRMLFLAHPAERRRSAAVEEISQIVSAETNALLDLGMFRIPAASQIDGPGGERGPRIHNDQEEKAVKRIDTHNHVIPETIIDAMKAQPELYATRIEGKRGAYTFARGKTKFELIPEFYDADAKIESMDRKRIDIAYISPGPQTFFYGLGADHAESAARLVNDGVARMATAYPDRLRGMATLPMQHPDAAIAELERVVKEYGFKAVEMGTAIGEEELADARFRPVLRRLQELKMVLFTHPNTQGSGGRLDCWYLTNLIGNPLDTTIMVGKLMFSGALDELKDLKILLAHGGGFLPYQIGRFQHGHTVRPDTSAVTQSKPFDMFANFYFDALTHDPRATRHLLQMVGSARVVLGTDSPFDMGEERPVQHLDAVPGLTDQEREDVSYRTALALFGEKL